MREGRRERGQRTTEGSEFELISICWHIGTLHPLGRGYEPQRPHHCLSRVLARVSVSFAACDEGGRGTHFGGTLVLTLTC